MSKHEQHSRHSETAAGKEGGCCGGAHDHDCGSPESKTAELDRKPAVAGQGLHTHTGNASGSSCGCGGKHK